MTMVSVEFRSIDGSGWESRGRLSGRVPPQPATASAMPANRMTGLCRMGPDRMGDRQDGHADAEMRARIHAVDDLDGAAMGIDELQHDRQADAGALDLNAGGRAPRIKRFEYAGALFGGNACAGVGDIDHELGVLFRGM